MIINNDFVSEETIQIIRNKAIDKLKSNCIEHIQKNKPLTIEEIVNVVLFEAERLKGGEM